MATFNIEFIIGNHFVVDECEKILSIIESVAPGVCDQIPKLAQDGGPTQYVKMEQYRTKGNKLLYRVPLYRNLLSTEAERIKEQVSNYVGKKLGVKYTSIDQYKKPIKVEPVDWEEKAILTSAARKRHDIWVNKMVENGWTYGITENAYKKTHPLLRPWSSLPTETMRQDLAEVKLIKNS